MPRSKPVSVRACRPDVHIRSKPDVVVAARKSPLTEAGTLPYCPHDPSGPNANNYSHSDVLMKDSNWPHSLVLTSSKRPARSRLGCLASVAAVVLGLSSQVSLNAQSDNFDAYSTPAELTAGGWILSSLNPALVTTTFPSVGSGKGLRVQANPIPSAAPAVGLWYRTNDYTDFYVAVDLVNWLGTDKNQAAVLFGRMTDAGTGTVVPNLNPANAQGVICNYDTSQYGENPTDRRQGQLQINRVGAGFATSTRAVAEITFVPGRSYRLVFKCVGTVYTVQAYDMNDLTAPLVTLTADIPDAFTPNGACGILAFSRNGTAGTVDQTFDNYYAAATDPNTSLAPALAHPIAGTPQVVTRNPVKRWMNFQPVASPLSFSAQTLTANEINSSATKLYLNGADVSSALQASVPTGNAVDFTAPAGLLAANKVYAARIELVDTAGTLTSTNTFWFDTYTQGYFSNAPVKTIEVEDYNYNGGAYQLDPIAVSGYDTNFTLVNGGGVGYVDLPGTPEVDFHDNRASGESSYLDYRPFDPVGTSTGNKDISMDSYPLGAPLPLDVQRLKYTTLSLQEYVVARTEVGEWLNYTRAFADANYLVYLRVGSFGASEVELAQVTGDTTTTTQTATPLGRFVVPNNIMHINETYVPLQDTNGAPVVVHLAGTNTLRLTMLGTVGQDNRKLHLNYLLLVPAPVPPPTVLDTFNDGNDTANPAWDHYDPIGGLTAAPATFSFPNGGYRILAPAPAVPDAGQARAGSFLRNGDYSDFYISVDVTDFDDTVRSVFGIAARINTPGLQTTDGYLFSWEPGGGVIPGTDNGDLDVIVLSGEIPLGQIETPPSGVHLSRGKTYRMVFMGNGNNFIGRVYEHPDLSNPIKEVQASDPNFLYASGRVGLIVASQGSVTIPADATFDNFLVTTAEPRLTANVSGGSVVVSWPLIPFRLLTSSSLTAPNWTEVTSGIVPSGGMNTYTVPATSQQYFRLVYP